MSKPKDVVKAKVDPVEAKTEAMGEATPVKAEPKKTVLTIAGVFQNLAQKGSKDRKTLAEAIVKYLADKGVTTNVRGHTISVSKVGQQISAMLRDIKQERGKSKGSWWSKFDITEDKDVLKITPKA